MQARQAELSRKESKQITRMRLLEGGLHLLTTEGYAALTVSKIAKFAGIAQPSFYVHFRDKDDLLETLAREKFAMLRADLKATRSRMTSAGAFDWTSAITSMAAIGDTFRISLKALLDEPELFRLYICERNQPNSPLSGYARELTEEFRRDLAEDLVRLGAPFTTAEEREHLDMVAVGIVSLTENLGMGLLEGRFSDVERVVDTLVKFTLGALPYKHTAKPSQPIRTRT